MGSGSSASPSREQLRAHFVQSAVPMVGFGFMDNTIMLHAGNAIDMTLGVAFGLSTLSAAACGQICSDLSGVIFGGVIEAAAAKLGLPTAQLTEEQRVLPVVKRIGLFGSGVGVVTGCSLGMLNLFIIDTRQADELKLAAASADGGFSVSLSNSQKEGVTVVTVEGPADIHGVMAAATTAVAAWGCKIVDVTGCRREEGLSITYNVVKDEDQVEDDFLRDLARSVLAACNCPERVYELHRTNEQLKKRNEELFEKLARAEALLEERLIIVEPRGDRREKPLSPSAS